MIEITRATSEHVEGISRVCSEGCLDTYKELKSIENIKRNNEIFYNYDRIYRELEATDGWDGYFAALDNDRVVGAVGGGMTGDGTSEVYVLYLDPERRREGIGTLLLNHLTAVQRQKGSKEQWVSVQKGNQKGIPFYEARDFKYMYEKGDDHNVEGEDYKSLRYCRDI